jgi:hypothetical protein
MATRIILNPNDVCTFCRITGHCRTIKQGTKIFMICPELCQTCWGSYQNCVNKRSVGKDKNGCGSFNPNKLIPSQRDLQQKTEIKTIQKPIQKQILPSRTENRFENLNEEYEAKPIKDEPFPILGKGHSKKNENSSTISFAQMVAKPSPIIEKIVKVVSTNVSENINTSKQIDYINPCSGAVSILINRISDIWTPKDGYGSSGFDDSEIEFLNYVEYDLGKFYPTEAYDAFLYDDNEFCKELGTVIWPNYIKKIQSSS